MKKALLLGLAACGALAYSCGADPLYREETDTVVTLRASGSQFSGYETYYLPTSVIDLCVQPSSGDPTSDALGGAAGGPSIDPTSCRATDHASDGAMLATIEEHMDDLGYVRVSEAESEGADLAILVGIVSKVSWNLQAPYCYPNAYWGGCVDQSENPEYILPFNSVVIQMVDVDASSGDLLEQVWTVGMNQDQAIQRELGTSLGGGPAATKRDIWETAIEQAFSQSPYLAEGGR